MVILKEISKIYNDGKIVAVDRVSFNVNKGELFGLIGPDGAGKTSLFRILTTLILPQHGSASVAGFDVVKDYKKVREIAGYMPGKFSLYQDLTVEENLTFFASLFKTSIRENYDLVKDIYVQIEPFKNRRAGKLSGGMKQKLALCCALIHKPKVLFLDEPTTGVDAVSRREFWDMLRRLKQLGITILVSTPYMDEAVLCDRIALLQTGTLLSINTPENIINEYPELIFAVKSDDIKKLLKDLRNMKSIISCYAFGEYLHISSKDDQFIFKEELEKYLIDCQHINIEIKKIKPTIEDCFIKLMKLN